ncbi:MAG: thiamine phosphate synthase [Gammaproteobacteria bacterium]|nr:thiamine phosphate synthase [Gammaproteobacteria bacterium]
MSRIHGLYAISSPSDTLLQDVESALKGGVDVFQYRDKHSPPGLRHRQASELKALCERYGVVYIINDDIELALAVDADGVHLGREDGDIRHARSRLGDKIIGVSCYNRIDLALEAQQLGVDYVAFGRFFPSRTKPAAVQADMELLDQSHRCLSLPVVAIGGICVDNAPQLIDAGADAIAVIDGLFGQAELNDVDIEARARALKDLFVFRDQTIAVQQ